MNNNYEFNLDLDENKKDDENKMSELRSYAIAYNYLSLMSEITYGTKLDFISDNMQRCIENDIILKQCCDDPIWKEHDILFEDVPNSLKKYIEKRTVILRYSDDPNPNPRYWNYEFKHVILPNGWKLKMDCGCHRNMEPACFTIYDDKDMLVKTLTYFSSFDGEDGKSSLERIADLDDKIWDSIENQIDKN